MSIGALNWIIGVSLAGIVAVFSKNMFFTPHKIATTVNATPPQTQVTPPTDPEVLCKSSYFNFEKGAQWNYTITTKTQGNGQKAVVKTESFTSSVVEALGSAVLIESQYKDKKEKVRSKITCRQSGMYGLPLPLLPNKINIKLDTILLLPSEQNLQQDATWKSSVGTLGLSITSRVVDKTENTITINGKLESDMSFVRALLEKSNSTLSYSLKKGIGLTNLHLIVDIAGMERIEVDLKLHFL